MLHVKLLTTSMWTCSWHADMCGSVIHGVANRYALTVKVEFVKVLYMVIPPVIRVVVAKISIFSCIFAVYDK